MNLSSQLAKHFRDVHFGGNWTTSNLRDNLDGVTWQMAITKVDNLNTIGMLVFHMNYYVSAILNVFRGTPFNAHDKYSYDLPPIKSQQEWDTLIQKTFSEAEELATYIEKVPEEKWMETFVDPKYGNFLRNILGVTEHNHYHLGQIAIIKKILLSESKYNATTAETNS